MKSTDAPEQVRPFIFHGVDCTRDPQQSTADCPFCEAPGKFSIKTETGQYRCLRCEEAGNAYSFLFRLHQLSTEGTAAADYQQLSKLWGCSTDSLKYFGVCRSSITGEWLIPAYNVKGNLANLYRLIKRKDEQGKDKLAPMSTPGCKLQPFGTNHLVNSPKPVVWVTEGCKDGCNLYDALATHRQAGSKLIKTNDATQALLATQAVLPLPGCGNFNGDWLEVLAGKEVRVVFDNDHPKVYGPDHEKAGEQITTKGKPVRPGWDGMERIAKLVGLSKHRPSKLFVMFWQHLHGNDKDASVVFSADAEQGHSPSLKDGFDIADLFKHSSSVALRLLVDSLEQVAITSPKKAAKEEKDVPTIEPIHRDTFEDLCGDWSAVLHFTQQLRDTLAIMLSVVLSTESEKVNHLWLRVIGPPGSGKSTLAEAISVAREWVAPKSIITGFHSGFIDPNADEPTSASLIPLLDNKCVIMKDGDTLANSPGRDKILSELRDLYDGTSRAHYRTGQQDEFEDVRLSFILCGTDELRQLNRTFLGERFIDCEIMARGQDHTPYLQRASSNTYSALAGFLASPKESDEAVPQDRMMFLKQVTYGFIKFLKENYHSFPIPAINATIENKLQAMGEYVALMRARVRHDHNDSSFRPRAELPTRLTSIFTKLAFFAALVLRKTQIDEEVLRLVLKVVHDTSIGLQQEITEHLALGGESGCSPRQIQLALNVPETTIRRQLGDMRQYSIAQPYTSPNNSGQRGRDRHLWCLTDNMRALWNRVYTITNQGGSHARAKPKAGRKGNDRRQHRTHSR